MRTPRFSLSFVLLLIATFACLFQYARFIGGARVRGGKVDLVMTDEYIQQACSDHPLLIQRLVGPTGGGIPLQEHAHLSIYIHHILLFSFVYLCITLGVLAAIGSSLRVLARTLLSRPGPKSLPGGES